MMYDYTVDYTHNTGSRQEEVSETEEIEPNIVELPLQRLETA